MTVFGSSDGMSGAETMFSPVSRVEYFEIDSRHVGDHFGIGVSLPDSYERKSGAAYPLLYATDGNICGPVMEAVRFCLGGFDADPPLSPYVQINIGYPQSQARSHSILRNRDLIPPGEPIPTYLDFFAHARNRLGPAAPESAVQELVAQYQEGRADDFLAFIEYELHPEICKRYAIDSGNVGLFGHSSGGLFALYALMSGSQLFSKIGAASPGIHTEASRVFSLYEQMRKRPTSDSIKVHVHITLTNEMLGPVRLYRNLSINSLRFFDMLRENPPTGMRITAEVVSGDTHYGGFVDSYRSFVRACYSSRLSGTADEAESMECGSAGGSCSGR